VLETLAALEALLELAVEAAVAATDPPEPDVPLLAVAERSSIETELRQANAKMHANQSLVIVDPPLPSEAIKFRRAAVRHGQLPVTRTGTLLDLSVPSPSWPNWLLPQHHTDPSLLRAHVCS
jgi:hypothetical protein